MRQYEEEDELKSTIDQSESLSPVIDHAFPLELKQEADGLMAEIQIWAQTSNFIQLHPRTQYGNHAYRHAIRIRLLRIVYGANKEDERVKEDAEAIMELAKEVLALYGKITWSVNRTWGSQGSALKKSAIIRLTWPLLIAGFNLAKDDVARSTASELLGEFGWVE